MTILTKLKEVEPVSDLNPIFEMNGAGARIYNTDSVRLMTDLLEKYPDGLFDMIFADPPYFLSNGGITCQSGRMVSVNKGSWDKSKGIEEDHKFNLEWLSLCQKLLKPNGTIWVSGTQHVIFSVGHAMQSLDFKILNSIAWEKTNPPPNLSCRYFTHSTETLLWAARGKSSKYVFNYAEMKKMNGNKQMQSVWRISAPANAEKTFGKHPTQKPLGLLDRCVRAATNPGALIFDPFLGSGTTAVAAHKLDRICWGCDMNIDYCRLAQQRLVACLEQKELF